MIIENIYISKVKCIGKLQFEIKYLIKIEVRLTYEKCEMTRTIL